jgi:hypothetical protein
MVVKLDEDELIEHWTLVGDELGQVASKRGATRLGFSLLLKFYARHGRFPRGRGELPDEAVAYVARQVGVPASDLGFYEWDGRTVEYHRAQVRKFLGFRECTVASSARSGTGRTATAGGSAPAIPGCPSPAGERARRLAVPGRPGRIRLHGVPVAGAER